MPVRSDGRIESAVSRSVLDEVLSAYRLTPAQHIVAGLVVLGDSNKLIATRRRVSGHTVRTQVGDIFKAADVSGRTEFLADVLRRVLANCARSGKLVWSSSLESSARDEVGAIPRGEDECNGPRALLCAALDEYRLTPAERAVAVRMLLGESNTLIAQCREVSPGTVRAQVGDIFKAAGVAGRTALLASVLKRVLAIANRELTDGRQELPAG